MVLTYKLSMVFYLLCRNSDNAGEEEPMEERPVALTSPTNAEKDILVSVRELITS